MTENAGNTENTGNTENVRNVAAKEGVCSLENAVNTENSTEMAGMEYAENTDSSENAQNKESTEAVPSQDRQLINRLIDRMTLFDDDLMSRVFDKNIAATELLLRIILGRKLKVISADGQVELKEHEVGGRTITLDVKALDRNGTEIDIEVQGNAEGAHVRRARYHSSVVDSRMLKEGQRFKEIKDSYVIFIYKHDKFRKGLPVYHIDRYVRETGKRFEDGSHIVYVNGNYKGDDEIGQLMQDFHQTDPEKMKYAELADSVKHYKDTEKGRDNVCEAVERYAKKYAKEYAKEYGKAMKKIGEACGEARGEARGEAKGSTNAVRKLMQNMKLTAEQALDILEITGEKRTEILEQLNEKSDV